MKDDNEEFEIVEDTNYEEKELKMVRIVEEDQTIIELSVNSVVGLSNPNTMKVRGKIKEKDVVILIDCGGTLNFILEKLTSEVQLTKRILHTME